MTQPPDLQGRYGLVLAFPYLPAKHKPYGRILRQNLADASEHLADANTRLGVLTEYERRWREEALLRYNRANMAMMFYRISTLRDVI
jgi:hypothetical protein